jgi:hypothetical protein
MGDSPWLYADEMGVARGLFLHFVARSPENRLMAVTTPCAPIVLLNAFMRAAHRSSRLDTSK